MIEHVRFSVSSWQQPMPPPAGAVRAAVLDHVEAAVLALGDRRVRSRSTDEPLPARRASDTSSRSCSRSEGASRCERRSMTSSGPGVRRTATTESPARATTATRSMSTRYDGCCSSPPAPEGSGRVALCSIDPLTQIDHSATVAVLPTDGVLVVDGVFALRPELNRDWDLRIWVHVDPDVSLTRGIARDAEMEGGASPPRLSTEIATKRPRRSTSTKSIPWGSRTSSSTTPTSKHLACRDLEHWHSDR